MIEKETLWANCISKQFEEESYESLDLFLELLSYIENNDISNKISKELYYNEELWNWLSSKEQIDMHDIKRELLIKIERADKIAEREYEDYINNIGKIKNNKKFVLCFNEENAFYIASLDKYYDGLRRYLAMEKKAEFCTDMVECFPNLFFVDDIATTINTLQRNFDDLRAEIVMHLTAINNYYDNFKTLLTQNMNNESIAREFSSYTGIECSPQAGRQSVENLKLSCYNTISQQKEIIKCELHTKFEKYNIDKTKQDRIYFFPGKSGIHDGKTIIKHIGKHL